MAGRLLEADRYRFPLSGSIIHRQEGSPNMVAVGPGVISTLPEEQKSGVDKVLKRTTIDKSFSAFLNIETGEIRLTDGGSFIAATVDIEGKIKSNVDWIK